MKIFQILVYILIPSLFAIYVWGKKRLNSLQAKGILYLEPSFPLGNMSGIGQTVHFVDRNQEIYEAFKKRDKIAGFYSMLKPTLLLLDLDLIKNVLIRDFNNFTDRNVYSNEDSDPVSAHMWDNLFEIFKGLFHHLWTQIQVCFERCWVEIHKKQT